MQLLNCPGEDLLDLHGNAIPMTRFHFSLSVDIINRGEAAALKHLLLLVYLYDTKTKPVNHPWTKENGDANGSKNYSGLIN